MGDMKKIVDEELTNASGGSDTIKISPFDQATQILKEIGDDILLNHSYDDRIERIWKIINDAEKATDAASRKQLIEKALDALLANRDVIKNYDFLHHCLLTCRAFTEVDL